MGPTRAAAQACRALIVAWLVALAGAAHATFIDTDFYCQNYGCVVAGDGTDFSVYDAFIFASNTCCVAANQPLILWTGGTLVGAGGPVTTVVTGTIAAAATPGATQYTRMGIDTDADTLANNPFADSNTSGFLDAGDALTPITLAATDRLSLVTRTVTRSVYLTSRMDFDVYGSGAKVLSTGTFGPAINLNTVGLAVTMTANGNDGIAFGAAAVNNPQFFANGAITNLGQVSPGPVRLAEFRRNQGIRQNNSAGANIMPQCVRFDLVYTLPPVDLSLGSGASDLGLTLTFYQRP